MLRAKLAILTQYLNTNFFWPFIVKHKKNFHYTLSFYTCLAITNVFLLKNGNICENNQDMLRDWEFKIVIRTTEKN